MNDVYEDLFADADEVTLEFYARFPGVCSETNRAFEAGDLIKADGDGGWIVVEEGSL